MRVPINLASRPYENLRPYYNVAVLAVIFLVALASAVAWNDWQNRRDTRLLTEQSRQLETAMAELGREQQELEQWLGRPEVQEIRDRSDFLNSLIVRKSLSWTQMFMDLETILPARAQVTAIRPRLNQDQQVEVNLTVAAASMGPLVEFLKKLEAALQFGSPVVHAQRPPSTATTDGQITLDLSVLYHQVALDQEVAPEEGVTLDQEVASAQASSPQPALTLSTK
ncbi:MAG: hypothetical protein V3T65_03775, partial [Acidobacteriota bacterium]